MKRNNSEEEKINKVIIANYMQKRMSRILGIVGTVAILIGFVSFAFSNFKYKERILLEEVISKDISERNISVNKRKDIIIDSLKHEIKLVENLQILLVDSVKRTVHVSTLVRRPAISSDFSVDDSGITLTVDTTVNINIDSLNGLKFTKLELYDMSDYIINFDSLPRRILVVDVLDLKEDR